MRSKARNALCSIGAICMLGAGFIIAGVLMLTSFAFLGVMSVMTKARA